MPDAAAALSAPSDGARTAPSPPQWYCRPVSALLIALVVGAMAATVTYRAASDFPQFSARDLTGPLRIARELRDGVNPYTAHHGEVEAYPRRGPTFYPLTAGIPFLPVARWSDAAVLGLWSALTFGALTYAALRSAAHRIVALLSWSAYRALMLGQWAPLFTAAATLGPLGALAVCKPNLGLALACYRPTRWIVAGGVLFLAISLALVPGWPGQWLPEATGASYYVAPATLWRIGGPLLLLAALRWRAPEGRLLLALACIPHNFVFYDQLLLFLVARNRLESLVLAIGSWVAVFVASAMIPPGMQEPASQVYFRAPLVVCMYFPALVMVLRLPRDRVDFGELSLVADAWRRRPSGARVPTRV
jgi:hypothetical protein